MYIPVWPRLAPFRPIWSGLVTFGPIFPHLSRLAQVPICQGDLATFGKFFFENFGGDPLLAPSKQGNRKKLPPMTPYDPHFLP